MITTSFNQSCPICGRKLLVPVECLGMEVQCSHCKGHFLAREGSAIWREDELLTSLNSRADLLLAKHLAASAAR